MTFDKFTIKAQEAVQEAVNTAQRNGQQAIEPVHLLKGVMVKAKDVTGFIFSKLGVNATQVEAVIDREINSLPRVQGGQPYLGNDTNAVLQRAVDISGKMVGAASMQASETASIVLPGTGIYIVTIQTSGRTIARKVACM